MMIYKLKCKKKIATVVYWIFSSVPLLEIGTGIATAAR